MTTPRPNKVGWTLIFFTLLMGMFFSLTAHAQVKPGGGATGGSGGIKANCPTCNLVDKTLTLTQTTGNAGIRLNGGAYICLNNDYTTPCLGSRIAEDGFGQTTIGGRFGIALDPGSTTAQVSILEGGFGIGTQMNNFLKITPNNAGTPVLVAAQGSNTSINIAPTGTGVLTQYSTSDPTVGVHASVSAVAQAMEYGAKTLTAGAGSVTFSPAFASAPFCVCDDTSAVVSTRCTQNASTLTIAGTGTDTVDYICIGAR